MQPGAGGLGLVVMRVYLKDKHIGLECQLWPPHLFQKHGQAIKRIEMRWVQMQCLFQIGQGGPNQPGRGIGLRAGMVTFGKIGRVI